MSEEKTGSSGKPRSALTRARSPILILGGAHAGKSELAVQLLAPDKAAAVLGTAPTNERAFAKRLTQLKALRPATWDSLDTGGDLSAAVADAAREYPQVLVDSISQWLAARIVMDRETTETSDGTGGGEEAVVSLIDTHVTHIVRSMQSASSVRFVLVSAEVGGGPAPARMPERLYRQHLGLVNQRLAAQAATVIVVHAGIPTVIKGEL